MTPEQIEAAAKVLCAGPDNGMWPHCLELAKAALNAAELVSSNLDRETINVLTNQVLKQQEVIDELTAAAGVTTEQHIERAKTEARDDWIAKVGKTQGSDSFHPDLVARHAAAAGAGDSAKEIERLTTALRVREQEIERLWDVEDATIERCAQWHDEHEKLFRMRAKEYLGEPMTSTDLFCHDAQDQVADWHRDAAAAIRARKSESNPTLEAAAGVGSTAFDLEISTNEAYDRGAVDAIDRCAQVADHYGDKLIAARILALKDKP